MQSVAIEGSAGCLSQVTGGDVKHYAARCQSPETHIVSTSIGGRRGL